MNILLNSATHCLEIYRSKGEHKDICTNTIFTVYNSKSWFSTYKLLSKILSSLKIFMVSPCNVIQWRFYKVWNISLCNIMDQRDGYGYEEVILLFGWFYSPNFPNFLKQT